MYYRDETCFNDCVSGNNLGKLLSRGIHQHPTIEIRKNVWNADYDQMRATVSAASWTVPPSTRIEEQWTSFTRTSGDVTTWLSRVSKVRPRRTYSLWMNHTVEQLHQRRNRAWKFYREEPSTLNYRVYKCRQNDFQRVLKERWRCYEDSLVQGRRKLHWNAF